MSTHLTLGQVLIEAAQRYGDAVFAICGERVLTFAEANRLSGRFAEGLRQQGLKAGDRVTLWIQNDWQWIVAYFGILKLGAVTNPVNSLLTADEVKYIVRDCGSKAIVAGAQQAAGLGISCNTPTFIDLRCTPARAVPFESVLIEGDSHADSMAQDIDVRSTAAIFYTSGTTGHPKGAVLSHLAIVTNTMMTALMHGRQRGDVIVSALPCPHVYGNIVLNTAVACGMSIVLMPRFDEIQAFSAIKRYRATLFEGVPTMYLRMLASPELDSVALSSLRLCTVGGQTMPVSKMAEVERRFGCKLVELWGMTELGGLGVTHPHNSRSMLGSIGVPLPFLEAKVVDVHDSARELAAGGVGELLMRGPIMMDGYYGNDLATAQTIDADGWLHTGDLVERDKDGYIYVMDRVKEVILSGGYNVYPAEVERVVAEHPSVAMVAVAALNDPLKGQVPKAFVVLRPNGQCSVNELIEHCRSRLAPFKVPKTVEFVSDLPKTSSGKILRRLLASSAESVPLTEFATTNS